MHIRFFAAHSYWMQGFALWLCWGLLLTGLHSSWEYAPWTWSMPVLGQGNHSEDWIQVLSKSDHHWHPRSHCSSSGTKQSCPSGPMLKLA
jgi:hypothetical protein